MPRDKKKRLQFEDSAAWIARANKDYDAFKRLGSSDPALSVYLLQQCIEKTIKAIAISSGKYRLSDIRGFSHKSAELLLDFWDSLEVAYGSSQKYKSVLPSMIQMDEATPEEVLATIQLLEELHKHSLFFIKHSNIENGDTITLSFSAVTEYSLKKTAYISGREQDTTKKQSLKDLSFRLLLDFSDMLSRSEDKTGTIKSKDFCISRFLGQWSLFALFILGSITFSHEHRSRYPDMNGKGCDNYTEALGIVKYRKRLGDICKMSLSYVGHALETMPESFPVAKSGT